MMRYEVTIKVIKSNMMYGIKTNYQSKKMYDKNFNMI